MPQLDFFTLLFQFKSFFIFFFYLIISIRRSQVLNLLSYYNFLKFVTYFSFYSQCFFLKTNVSFLNDIFTLFFNKYLGSKFSISHLLFTSQNF